jgi:hypothetical protein
MILPHCEQEPKVSEAIRAGRLDPALQRHVSECALCADVMLVSGFLWNNSAMIEHEITLPTADLVWLKAQLRSRQAAAERATQPIALFMQLALATAALAGSWFVSSSAPARDWILGAIHSASLTHASFSGELGLLTGFGIILCTVIGSFFTLRA